MAGQHAYKTYIYRLGKPFSIFTGTPTPKALLPPKRISSAFFSNEIKKDENGMYTHGVAANVDVFTVLHQKSGAAAVRDLIWPVLPGHLRHTEGSGEG